MAPVSVFRRTQAVEEAMYRCWMSAKRKNLKDPTQLYGKEDAIVSKTNHPAMLRDGRFSFWRDIRPPFTITGMGPLQQCFEGKSVEQINDILFEMFPDQELTKQVSLLRVDL